MNEEVFDTAARSAIRKGIRRYMSEHNVGVPTLKKRIEDADERKRVLDQRSLQRFLSDEHRTSDHYVAMCAGFLKKQNMPLEPEDFGDAFASFLGAKDSGPGEAVTPTVEGMAGVYKIFESRPDAETPLPVREKNAHPSSYVTLRALPGQPFLIAEEDFNASPHPKDRRRIAYDGIALLRGSVLYTFLRNGLTRRPKTYCVQFRSEGPRIDAFILEGEGFEYPAAQGPHSHFKTQFVAQLEERSFHGRS